MSLDEMVKKMSAEMSFDDDSHTVSNALPDQRPLNTFREEYRCVHKGDGGTLNIDQGIRRIGTISCDYSVGVYFQIDKDRSFCAHMAMKTPIEDITKEQGVRLQEKVKDRLQAIRTRDKWPIEDDNFGYCMTLLCRRPTYKVNAKRIHNAGWYMVEGVRDFIQAIVDKLNPIADEAQIKAWDALGVSSSDGFDPYPGKHVRDLGERAKELTTKVLCLEDRVLPKMTAITDGKGFVIDSAEPWGPYQSRVLRLDGDGRGVNIHTGDTDGCEWIAKFDKVGKGDWLFSLD